MDKKVHSKLELEAPTHRPRVGAIRLFINGKKYRIHPVYNLYAGNKYGEVINISRFVSMKGRINYGCGYRQVMVRGSGDRKQTCVRVRRFIYECYYGIIPEGMVIDHINDDKQDNRLCNLQLVTPQQNSKKAARNRGYFNNYENIKRVKAINLETNEITHYDSLSAAAKHLDVNPAGVYHCCRGIRKSSTSKIDGCKYAFEYA